MLDVHPRPALVDRIEVESGEFGAHSPIRCPAQTLPGIVEIAVAVDIFGQPDIIALAAGEVLDDVDVPLGVDGEVVDVAERLSDGGTGGQITGAPIRENARSSDS